MTEPAPAGGVPRWHQVARDYAKYRTGPPSSFYSRLRDVGVGLPGQRILDLGTGPGQLARQFARQGAIVAGIDPDPGQLAMALELAAQEGLAVDFRQASAEAIPFGESRFDAVTGNQCWQYFDPGKALRELKRVTLPGAPIVVSFFAWLAIADPIAKRSEDLVLEFAPDFPDAGWSGQVPPTPKWAPERCVQTAAFVYDEAIPFTHEAWRGRMRANRSTGAQLAPEDLQRFDGRLADLLRASVPDPFTVLHRIGAYVLVQK